MVRMDLDGTWQLEIVGETAVAELGISAEVRDAQVPGSVYGALLAAGEIPDPYMRDNELRLLPLMENDFIYSRSVEVPENLRNAEEVILHFSGIDTLADIYWNDTFLGHTDNMHRSWEYVLTDMVNDGENRLRVVLHSPTKFCREENEKVFAGGTPDAMRGYPHLRKAHCMFGWDWGPRLPDAGLFRSVCLLGISEARLGTPLILQEHEKERVRLWCMVPIERVRHAGGALNVAMEVVDPMGHKLTGTEISAEEFYDAYARLTETPSEAANAVFFCLDIADPQLWWPAGYGDQPLYTVRFHLLSKEEEGEGTGKGGSELDCWQQRIGLRQVTVVRRQDEWGECFAHSVNGLEIFAMGANYIPEDNLLERVTPERTRALLTDAVAAHHNLIRVWGGGYYPDDYFYDICDELGLLVWQDFMFACANYELDDAFEENIRREITENVRRIRHHACIALWCGNNEMETQTLDKTWRPSAKQKYDYIKIFEYIIPKIVAAEDPQAFYWPSSPSSGGNYDNPWDENKGDAHYWDVWHGNKPFTDFRKYHFRYLSEFGFQSFPCLRTVETFTEPEDRNIFSRIMEMHQRNIAANGKILYYLSETYLYPKDFESLLYASQLLQAAAIRYGVEHFRRHRGRCMGTIVWQLNDIWPTASWSSIDYYGQWKALHYAEKRMFAPILLSCEEKGEISERPYCIAEPAPLTPSARLHVANETRETVRGTVRYRLCLPDSSVLQEGQFDVEVPPFSGVWLPTLTFTEEDVLRSHLTYAFYQDGQDEPVSSGSSLFTAPKHYPFVNPELSMERNGDECIIRAHAYAQQVCVEGRDGSVRLSDNFFDMEAGERRVRILSGDASEFCVRSVYDIAH